MMTMLLPEIANSSLRPLDEAVSREDTAPSTGDLRIFASSNLLVVRLIAELWGQEHAHLKEGVCGRSFLRTIEAFLDSLRTATRVIARVDLLADSKGSEAKDVTNTTAEARVEIDRLLGDLSRFKELLDLPPVSAELIARVEKLAAETPESEYLTHDDILTRLQAGEEV